MKRQRAPKGASRVSARTIPAPEDGFVPRLEVSCELEGQPAVRLVVASAEDEAALRSQMPELIAAVTDALRQAA